MVDFTRPITHTRYKYEKKLKKYYHRVEKEILETPNTLRLKNNLEWEKNRYTDDHFISYSIKGNILPFWGGGISWFLVISGLFADDTFDGFGLYVYIFFCVLAIFFTVYYFTKPKKEQILNRRDGLITMTGFYWQNNITIPFKDCLFAYTTGGEDGTGAFNLQTIRPTQSWLNSFDDFGVGQGDCYKDMSFICWYMDKNRPLPPGTAFDAYRDRDYERRKAAGFPRPLYPSNIATPEATKEQQAERKRIGGW
ncbi:hypothetical protein [Aquimarina sp. I32.4]|uniref:hypothetical protein n=1 Tax=Aquimarina sp. I32.4 TaxID=2053903 RepID=UPI000CDED7BE|nr:hypothetical protein [Aquimarina sp. I32.4]